MALGDTIVSQNCLPDYLYLKIPKGRNKSSLLRELNVILKNNISDEKEILFPFSKTITPYIRLHIEYNCLVMAFNGVSRKDIMNWVNPRYKNIIGVRFDHNITVPSKRDDYRDLLTHFLLDYKSNNGFTQEQIDIGWGVDNLFASESLGELSFNIGLRNFSFNQISWGINYGINNLFNKV